MNLFMFSGIFGFISFIKKNKIIKNKEDNLKKNIF